MGNSNPKETCPSEMTNDASQETCPSDMANDASQNFIASYEKEEMEHFDIIKRCPLETKYDASQKCIGGKEDNIKERILRILEMNCQKAYIRELKEEIRGVLTSAWKTKKDLFKVATTKAEETNDLFKMVTTKAEKTNVLRQQVYELKEIFEKSMHEIKLCKKTIYKTKQCEYSEALNIADACCQVLRFILAAIDEWLESRMQLLIVLLAVLLLGNNDDRKRLARPERGKISCITVYLLGNDGAHSYNGNGIRFTKTIKYVRLTNEELVDQRGHGKPPMDVRLREPTDREIAKIARKIGREYVSLAILLGFTKAELDHFREDHRFTEHRVFEMLFKWRETKESNATIEKLTDALEELGINADIIYSSLD